MKQIKILLLMLLALSSVQSYAAKKVIGILAFDGVLTSSVTAPAEVFGNASKQPGFTDYEVQFIGLPNKTKVTTEEGLTITLDNTIDKIAQDKSMQLSTLIVPSRYEMEPLLKNKQLIQFIRQQGGKVEWLASNCAGAELLAEAGLLNGKRATTWAGGESKFQKKFPKVSVQHNQNYVIDGNTLTSNGSVVSYTAATKLLSLMSNKKVVKDVFDALQMGRLVDCKAC